jgi:hypothetical protein
MYAMGDTLTLEQRRVVASFMEVYGSPTAVRQKFAGRDPPSRLTIYRVYLGYFQQDGAPPHFALTVHAYLDHTFPH